VVPSLDAISEAHEAVHPVVDAVEGRRVKHTECANLQ
jgi:hypothetical protein